MTDPMPDDAIAAMASAMLDLTIPAACLPGVAANLALLAEHAARLTPDPGDDLG